MIYKVPLSSTVCGTGTICFLLQCPLSTGRSDSNNISWQHFVFQIRQKLQAKQVAMEKSEKAKQLRALRKYGKKVRRKLLEWADRVCLSGQIAMVWFGSMCVFARVFIISQWGVCCLSLSSLSWHHCVTRSSVVTAGESVTSLGSILHVGTVKSWVHISDFQTWPHSRTTWGNFSNQLSRLQNLWESVYIFFPSPKRDDSDMHPGLRIIGLNGCKVLKGIVLLIVIPSERKNGTCVFENYECLSSNVKPEQAYHGSFLGFLLYFMVIQERRL